jgi:hypothetical protein
VFVAQTNHCLHRYFCEVVLVYIFSPLRIF